MRTRASLLSLLAVTASLLTTGQGWSAPLKEDLLPLNYAAAEVKQVNGSWKIVVGTSSWLLDFGNDEANARKALAIMKYYKMDQHGFVTRPNPPMEYYLCGGRAPSGAYRGEDAIAFTPARLSVREINGKWTIVEGTAHYVLAFRNKTEAETGLEVIKKYGFNRICFVGRPNAKMTYFRR